MITTTNTSHTIDYNELFDQAPAGIAVVRGPSHIFEYANKTYFKFIKHTDIIGRRVIDAVPEVIEQGFVTLLDNVYQTGKAFIGNEVEISIISTITQQPEMSYLNFIYQPIKDKFGKPTGIFVQINDVTELVVARKMTEQLKIKAEEEAAKYNTVLDTLDDHVYYFGLDGAFLYANKSMLERFGLAPLDQLVGKRPEELVDKKLANKLDAEIKHVIKTKRSVNSAADYVNAMQVHNYYEYILSPLLDKDGNVSVVVGLSRNITQRRLTEKLQIETSNLEAQRDALTAVNKTKDEFIAIASHQLRTPATIVKQYLGMILSGYAGDMPSSAQPFIKIAYDSNERQLTILNDLLKAAQLDSGKTAIHKKSHNVCQMIGEVICDLTPAADIHQQTLHFNCEKEYYVHCDNNDFKLVIENLVGNAIKYSPESTEISVSVYTNEGYVCIDISDHGVGIATADQKKIFDKFSRLNNGFSATASGSGLGLYLVKRIVDLHNGMITIKSQMNKGTTFTICLPQ